MSNIFMAGLSAQQLKKLSKIYTSDQIIQSLNEVKVKHEVEEDDQGQMKNISPVYERVTRKASIYVHANNEKIVKDTKNAEDINNNAIICRVPPLPPLPLSSSSSSSSTPPPPPPPPSSTSSSSLISSASLKTFTVPVLASNSESVLTNTNFQSKSRSSSINELKKLHHTGDDYVDDHSWSPSSSESSSNSFQLSKDVLQVATNKPVLDSVSPPVQPNTTCTPAASTIATIVTNKKTNNLRISKSSNVVDSRKVSPEKSNEKIGQLRTSVSLNEVSRMAASSFSSTYSRISSLDNFDQLSKGTDSSDRGFQSIDTHDEPSHIAYGKAAVFKHKWCKNLDDYISKSLILLKKVNPPFCDEQFPILLWSNLEPEFKSRLRMKSNMTLNEFVQECYAAEKIILKAKTDEMWCSYCRRNTHNLDECWTVRRLERERRLVRSERRFDDHRSTDRRSSESERSTTSDSIKRTKYV